MAEQSSLVSYSGKKVVASHVPEKLPVLNDEEKARDPSDAKVAKSYKHIKNKQKRALTFQKDQREEQKEERKKKEKRKRERDQLGDEAPPKKIPHTVENTRKIPDNIVEDQDDEIFEEEETDELSSYFSGGKQPKVILTTSRNASAHAKKFASSLESVIPNSEYFNRKTFLVKEILDFAEKRDYTDVIIVNENKKKMNRLLHCHLPNGPTATYRISSVVDGKEIKGHGRNTHHVPELVLNNFNTKLARQCGRMFACLFPQTPEFYGRKVVTFHNQRDFIFFRQHRYIFDSDKKARLQEIGPSFTLKLRSLQYGRFDPSNQEFEFVYKPKEVGKSHKDFYMF